MVTNDYLFVASSLILILFVRNLVLAIKWEMLRRGFYALSDKERQKIIDSMSEMIDENEQS